MDNRLPKTFLNRLHLRANWLMWVMWVLCLLAILLSTFPHAFGNTIIYPVAVIYPWLVVIAGCVSLIVLVVVIAWVASTTSNSRYLWILPLAFGGSIYVCCGNLQLGLLGIVIAILLLVGFAFYNSRRQGSTALFAVLAVVILVIQAYNLRFTGFEHHDSLSFGAQRYNLALLNNDSGTDYGSCHNYYYVAYECDSLGLICRPLQRLGEHSACWGSLQPPGPTELGFVADSTLGKLFVEIDGERFPITP